MTSCWLLRQDVSISCVVESAYFEQKVGLLYHNGRKTENGGDW
ncbi:hypothetical protein NEIMUCOT_05856 [Neisseria mucosa ATCC 25996]|uniref:Uncharacterized protein n=1 Tax=Neisseria mucosa (strain ATCC 25996 / DSM 4631 / NCTC 10774 / M26) TaxID=546266 RepID=D2ZYZ1_NEIM2|nr:hypothetical protein NEIMUCOT_05856 [Neisseria mucosa ATCC 25996]